VGATAVRKSVSFLVVPAPVEASPFTPLEREILSLVASGRTAREIADVFAMPPRTVVQHIDVCKHKLGVKKNSELVARAMSSGQLTG
jgi:LuxR family transcriptional regulator of spore coat protein